jgi:prepilin-type N-terminal cleavage/methylation domain-containing protein/prepilin-type processing-associated H-X9-DG protein
MAHVAPTSALASRVTQSARRSPVPQFGFTLVELLVVIAVITIMAALLLPALSKTKEHSRATACRSNMKQLALAFLLYSEDNTDVLPWPGGAPGRANMNPGYDADWCFGGQKVIDPSLSSSWYVPGFGFNPECGSIYPYMTSQPRRDYDQNYKEVSSVYRCPSTGRLGEALRNNYSANAWTDPGKPFGKGAVPSKGLVTSMIVDPSRKVMLVNEDPKGMITCALPPGVIQRTSVFHLERANVAFMDGHMGTVPGMLFRQMQGKDSDVYFNCGR